jgi:hypothetical protein
MRITWVSIDVLNAQWLKLKKGQKEIVVLNPYPMCYPNDVCDRRPNIITLGGTLVKQSKIYVSKNIRCNISVVG